MRLKIPPVIIALATGLAMWFFDTNLFSGLVDIPYSFWISRFLLLAAVILGVLSLLQFYRHSTTVDPHNLDKITSVVTGGIYSISRNPMYLALMLLLIGLGIRLDNLVSLLFIPLFIWYMNRFQIVPEEEVLAEKFGEDYQKYKLKVRRWI